MKKQKISAILTVLALTASMVLPTAAAKPTSVDDLFTIHMPAGLVLNEVTSNMNPAALSPLGELSSASDDLQSADSMGPLSVEPTAVIPGDGRMNIVNDSEDSGVCIAGKTFGAYLILVPTTYTSYAVTDEFKDFFSGSKMGGDNKSYNFDDATLDTNDYNRLAGQYMDSFLRSEDKTKAYEFARAIRQYVDDQGIVPADTAQVPADTGDASDHGIETAEFTDLSMGYYFVMSSEFTAHGLGVAADGAFVPIIDNHLVEIAVKGSIPTIAKEIWHDDLNAWDVVGDSQIGDDVAFRISSTLPSDVAVYQELDDPFYHYYITDTMSAGLTLNPDSIAVYTDSAMKIPLDAKYYTVYLRNADGIPSVPSYFDIATLDFLIDVDVLAMAEAGIELSTTTLYTGYNALLNQDATVAFDDADPNYDLNTVELTYSNNPNNGEQYGNGEDTVTHFTFEFGVQKLGEKNQPLAGAEFQVSQGNNVLTLISMGEKTLQVNGNDLVADYYVIAPDGYVAGTDETLVNKIVTTDGNSAGRFVVRGLNDAISYELKEIKAPDGYNLAEPIQFSLTAVYNSTGTEIRTITDDSPDVTTTPDSVKITVVNELRVILPATGGMGTVLFYAVGLSLMMGAVGFLVLGRRTKAKRVL